MVDIDKMTIRDRMKLRLEVAILSKSLQANTLLDIFCVFFQDWN